MFEGKMKARWEKVVELYKKAKELYKQGIIDEDMLNVFSTGIVALQEELEWIQAREAKEVKEEV